ncbi:MAG: DUF2911 domain-containing protein [Flavobacteriaceae bacterium]|nr:DUF2911 domain-containing protein [Bacteroidia bacterium]NNL62132.1 DUF2911 domain-containing protein [Flavobacteriaceae bacterium]
MNRFLKRFLLFLFVVAIGLFFLSFFNDGLFSRPLSPKKSVSLKVDDLELNVRYNRPSKRDREIFGGLVPFNEVWRTGANEATTFKTNRELMIGNEVLSKGEYTLWTIPNDTSWQVIFNAKQYPWGVDTNMKSMREPEFDKAIINVSIQKLSTVVEQFTIAFDNSTDNLYLTMAWDMTKIAVPLK